MLRRQRKDDRFATKSRLVKASPRTGTMGQALPSELRLREGSSTPNRRTLALVWQLNPNERTHGLRGQTGETGLFRT